MIKYWASPSRAATLTILQLCPVANRVKGTNMGYSTNMGSSLFLVSKKHHLPETIRNIQREQKKK